mmetsp:Transcript_7459/g.25523  ORF Transcript_7459/g.25523 Transcript_7459/m.25523 type:complete len:316 (+) Transcript_7459:352-1299(+)
MHRQGAGPGGQGRPRAPPGQAHPLRHRRRELHALRRRHRRRVHFRGARREAPRRQRGLPHQPRGVVADPLLNLRARGCLDRDVLHRRLPARGAHGPGVRPRPRRPRVERRVPRAVPVRRQGRQVARPRAQRAPQARRGRVDVRRGRRLPPRPRRAGARGAARQLPQRGLPGREPPEARRLVGVRGQGRGHALPRRPARRYGVGGDAPGAPRRVGGGRRRRRIRRNVDGARARARLARGGGARVAGGPRVAGRAPRRRDDLQALQEARDVRGRGTRRRDARGDGRAVSGVDGLRVGGRERPGLGGGGGAEAETRNR